MSETTTAEVSPDELDTRALFLQAQAATIRVKSELAPVYAFRLSQYIEAEVAAVLAERAVAEPTAETDRLRSELAGVSGRAQLASVKAGSADWSARVDAHAEVAACEQETANLSERLREAQARLSVARAAANVARREADCAASLSAEAADALGNPLSHPLARATQAYQSFLIHSGLWMSQPKSATARQLVTDLLGPTGVGGQVQRDAIAAYLAGDPVALAAGGTDTLPDGRTVTRRPGVPSIVGRPRMSGQQARSAMDAVPQVPGDAWERARSASRDVIS